MQRLNILAILAVNNWLATAQIKDLTVGEPSTLLIGSIQERQTRFYN